MKKVLLLLPLLLFLNCTTTTDPSKVKVVGAIRNVMWKGELAGTILLDTIQNRQGLYGLGPTDYLDGELLIIDGQSFVAKVNDDGTIRMEETYQAQAPFFVYANVSEWKELELDGIASIQALEEYLTKTKGDINRPFAFRIKGRVSKALIHVQNLPKGAKVSSPADAHVGQMKYEVADEEVEIVGFYSTKHQGIFTHHDSYVHMHLITSDRTKMGHLDEVVFDSKTKLYIPKMW
jgi:acetolactate decarboxylase